MRRRPDRLTRRLLIAHAWRRYIALVDRAWRSDDPHDWRRAHRASATYARRCKRYGTSEVQ